MLTHVCIHVSFDTEKKKKKLQKGKRQVQTCSSSQCCKGSSCSKPGERRLKDGASLQESPMRTSRFKEVVQVSHFPPTIYLEGFLTCLEIARAT